MIDKTQARQKHKMAGPTNVPLSSSHDLVKWVLSSHASAPRANAIWVTLMENMEKAANVNREN